MYANMELWSEIRRRVTGVARSVGASISPMIATVLVGSAGWMSVPFFLAGGLKVTEGRTIAVVGDVYRFLATGEDTNGKYALWEAIVPPGGGPPPHVHSREEEGFYILEGEITFQVGDERIVATAGMFANMPVGTPHSFKNESEQPGEDADLRRPCRPGADVLRVRRAGCPGIDKSEHSDIFE